MGRRGTYTNIIDKQLEKRPAAGKVLQTLPYAGKSYMIGACRQCNINVQRQRIKDPINNVDLVTRALRKSIFITRWVYIPAPSLLWNMCRVFMLRYKWKC